MTPSERISLSKGSILEYVFRPDRESLNSSKVYAALASSDKLLSDGFFNSLSQLVVSSGELDNLLAAEERLVAAIEGGGRRSGPPAPLDLLTSLMDAKMLNWAEVVGTTVRKVPSSRGERKGLHRSSPKLFSLNPEVLKKYCADTGRRILELNGDVVRFEESLKRVLGLDIEFADRKDLYLCACGVVFARRRDLCPACSGKVDANPRSLARTTEDVVAILKRSVWLELAVARVFRSRGFQVVTGGTFRGHSGVEHELDVVANLPKCCAVEVEVTEGNANLKELADLLVRMQEFPFQRFALVSLGPADTSAAEFARFHGIRLFPEFRSKSPKLGEWIQALPTSHPKRA